MSENHNIKIDFCSFEAAKYACLNWHYSKVVPSGKMVRIGVWEYGKFIGVVLFGYGANPNLYKAYGITQVECCELTRIALTKHTVEVTCIVKRAIQLLRKLVPGLRMIVSFADANSGHIGSIYQAGNWIYTGRSKSTPLWLYKGKWVRQRTIGAQMSLKNLNTPKKAQLDKYRYIMPLDKKMRRDIIKLSKPYPKKICPEGVTGSTSGVQLEGDSSSLSQGLEV